MFFIEINGVYYNIISIAIVKAVEIQNGDTVEYCIEYHANSGGCLVEKFDNASERDAKIQEVINRGK